MGIGSEPISKAGTSQAFHTGVSVVLNPANSWGLDPSGIPLQSLLEAKLPGYGERVVGSSRWLIGTAKLPRAL